MTLFHSQYYVFAPSDEFVRNLQLVSPKLKFSADNNSFQLVGSGSRVFKNAPRTALLGHIRTTELGIVVEAKFFNSLHWTEILCCVLMFALWVTVRACVWQFYLEGSLLTIWWIKTFGGGSLLLSGLFAYCYERSKEKHALLAAVREAAALTLSTDAFITSVQPLELSKSTNIT